MSASVALQDAVLAALVGDAGVAALVADRIYDRPPAGAAFPYISFGPSDYVLDDTDCIDLRIETLQIDVWARAEGRLWPARRLVDAVKAALHLVDLSLSVHALALLRVEAVRVFLDPDGITGHGVITLQAEIEER
ncbi:DUF3168 domain-containing protein [Arenibacterium halophilum]|uniref:DUF3168 domain-containing protein n=1 Tax=Arenibacterium halophilum TaxID=2583821 RepID=A0ABY2WX08_9RHOB|nr:DUF3168 domain-containing protein [Arenibacterium halophilum]TMV07313.1 DUF3168 domain-containing protein [Arenibacterium halophilum]